MKGHAAEQNAQIALKAIPQAIGGIAFYFTEQVSLLKGMSDYANTA